jgi:hypothetical protein
VSQEREEHDVISLDKDEYSIQRGRYRARINAELRRNNLRALPLVLSEMIYDAEVKRFEAHKAEVLGR